MVSSYLGMILDKFTAAGYEVTIHPTQDRGDAIICAKEACDCGRYDVLVCSGGDGTLNEVIQGCMSSETPCPIGYIPFGSTNDFARGLGIPKDSEAAVDTANPLPWMWAILTASISPMWQHSAH